MLPPTLDKDYVSEIDGFLAELEKTIPSSKSQKEESAKYARIINLRDNPNAKESKEII
jgi:hypothetical protein